MESGKSSSADAFVLRRAAPIRFSADTLSTSIISQRRDARLVHRSTLSIPPKRSFDSRGIGRVARDHPCPRRKHVRFFAGIRDSTFLERAVDGNRRCSSPCLPVTSSTARRCRWPSDTKRVGRLTDGSELRRVSPRVTVVILVTYILDEGVK